LQPNAAGPAWLHPMLHVAWNRCVGCGIADATMPAGQCKLFRTAQPHLQVHSQSLRHAEHYCFHRAAPYPAPYPAPPLIPPRPAPPRSEWRTAPSADAIASTSASPNATAYTCVGLSGAAISRTRPSLAQRYTPICAGLGRRRESLFGAVCACLLLARKSPLGGADRRPDGMGWDHRRPRTVVSVEAEANHRPSALKRTPVQTAVCSCMT
jgi:hypothetical protein